jgi:hypothetical protein
MRTYKVLGLILATVMLTPMAASARINHYYDNPQRGYYVPGNQGIYREHHGHGKGHRHWKHNRGRVVYYEPMPPRRLYRPVYTYTPVNYYGPPPGVNLNLNFR